MTGKGQNWLTTAMNDNFGISGDKT